MKLDVAKYSNNLAILATIFNPSSDAAQTPTACNAHFYVISGGAIAAHALGTKAMAEVDSKTGVWGVVVDVTGVTISTLLVVVTAEVGGVSRSSVKLLGDSGVSIDASVIVDPPQITATAGVEDQNANGPLS